MAHLTRWRYRPFLDPPRPEPKVPARRIPLLPVGERELSLA